MGPFPKLANRFINCSIINNNCWVNNLIKIILKTINGSYGRRRFWTKKNDHREITRRHQNCQVSFTSLWLTLYFSSDNKAFYVNKDVVCISKHLATILQSKELITTSILKVGSRRANQKSSTLRLRPKFLRYALNTFTISLYTEMSASRGHLSTSFQSLLSMCLRPQCTFNAELFY